MSPHHYTFKTKIWIYPGQAAWHFVTLPVDESKIIKDLHGFMRGGFGSIPVTVTLGNTSWKTSIFPDKKANAYLLPLKAEIRKKENCKTGDTITVSITIE